VIDSPALLAADIRRKNHGAADPAIVDAVAAASGPAVEWLADRHGVPFELLTGFLYPGFSVERMHTVPEKTGAALMAHLLRAASTAGVDILCDARVTDLCATRDGRVTGARFVRPDGTAETVGCDALVLACSGFGGNAALVARHIPELAGVDYFGHAGNRGDAVEWGAALGAKLADMTAYQGHGSVATPHGVLITWALMMEGGIQVNAGGERFSNEHDGYSEQCVRVLAQPGRAAWNVYDARLHQLALTFPDYRDAEAAGAIRRAEDLPALARIIGAPAEALERTLADCAAFAERRAADPFGRDFAAKPKLAPPWFAVKVTGALFHTQGGLEIDAAARVLRADGSPLPNLFAGGGAARGLSGAHVWGYLSGNGLLSAVTLGRLAGASAAACAYT
jgi:fumarate reductase flavoprotein subunit